MRKVRLREPKLLARDHRLVSGGAGDFESGPASWCSTHLCFPGVPGPGGRQGWGCQDPSPEHHGVVEVAGGGQAGDGPLRGKAGLHEGPRVEHAQEPVDDDLGGGQWDLGWLAGPSSPG